MRFSQFGNQSRVLRVRTDPEPDNLVLGLGSKRPPSQGHSHRVHARISLCRLEMQAGVVRVALEVSICLNRLPLDVCRQAVKTLLKFLGSLRDQSESGSSSDVRPSRSSRNASSASMESVSLLSSSDWSQRNSPSMSASKLAAIASWRSGGSCCTF